MTRASTYTLPDLYNAEYHLSTTLGKFLDMSQKPDVMGNNLESPSVRTETPQFVQLSVELLLRVFLIYFGLVTSQTKPGVWS